MIDQESGEVRPGYRRPDLRDQFREIKVVKGHLNGDDEIVDLVALRRELERKPDPVKVSWMGMIGAPDAPSRSHLWWPP